MKFRTFKEWYKLRETGTSTGDVAHYAVPTLPMVRRGVWGQEDPFFKKKKKKHSK